MSKMIKNEETGEEEEVFTADEVQAQREEEVKKYQEEHPDQSAELTALEEKLKLAEEKLGKASDKDKNFAALRKQVEDLKTGIDNKIKDAAESSKKEVLEGVNKDHYEETLKTLAGTDDELKKKIEFHYKRLADPSSTKSEITAKLKDAYTLATGQSTESMNASQYGSGGSNRPKTKTGTEKLSPAEKELAIKMAKAGGMKLEDKDFG